MKTIHVVAAIIWQDGRFLAARRSGSRPGSGLWEFPGGKIEQNESQEQALVRELQEELGIIVQEFEFWKKEEHSYSDYIVVLYFFHVRKFLNVPVLIEGHDALTWVLPSQTDDLDFLPADAQILAELKTFCKNV